MRTLPPAGAPLPLRDLLRGLIAGLAGEEHLGIWREELKEYFQVSHVHLVSSGKAALWAALRVLMRSSPGRREVIIPAYASHCLASAAARSGLPIVLCDIDPHTLDLDLERLRFLLTESTLALIPVHNYGLVCRLGEICRMAREKGVFVVEDAAQAAGASWGEEKAGAIGDIGILSLGRGKTVYGLGGGVMLTRHEALAGRLGDLLQKIPAPAAFSGADEVLEGLAMSLFQNPGLYGLPSRLPFLGLGANLFDPNFPIATFPPWKAAVARRSLAVLDRENEIRRENAARLGSSLDPSILRLPRADPAGISVYARFPVIFPSPGERDRAFRQLIREGLGASLSYAVPLGRIGALSPYLARREPCPGADFVAGRLLTLPTHPFLRSSDLKRIAGALARAEGRKGTSSVLSPGRIPSYEL